MEPNEQLLAAAKAGDVAAARQALQAGAEVDAVDGFGRTALMEASMRSAVEVMRVLLDAGTAVDRADSLGATALILAASGRARESVPVLLEHHADARIADRDDKTPLMWLVDLQFHRGGVPVEVIAPLVAGGAEPNARDHLGQTALMWAVKGDLSSSVRPAVLQELLRSGADVNVRDDRGETVMFGLVRYIDDVLDLDGGRECIEVFVAAGADRNARNSEGKTPLGVVNPPNTLVTQLLTTLGFVR